MMLFEEDRIHGRTNRLALLLGLIVLLGLSISSSFAQTSETFTASTTWVAPAGVTSVEVECWGAGGAGGGSPTNADGGGGGGGGAYSMTASISVVPGNSYTITVGVGGVGIAGGTGGNGGDTWFISSGTIFAQGGSGGNAASGAGGTGGSGGAAGSGIGTTRFSGGTGGAGRTHNQGQGGPGASSAGTAADGWSGPASWGGVTASAGPTGSGIGGNGGGPNQNGFPGSIPGGAGGGSGEGNSTGGNGANGQVILTYTAASDNCPESTSISPSGAQILCQGDASTVLTANATLSGGSGTPTVQYQWYYNTTNSNTVAGASLIGGATSSTYTPLTTATEVGDRWYFCVAYATDNGCGQTNADQALASNAVQVSVSGTPTTSVAGSPLTICDGDGAILAANTPTVGTGAWSVVSGPSLNTTQFSSLSDPAATFTPDGGAGDYVLRWTISNDPCTPSTSDVTITVNVAPTTSNAGGPQTICDGDGTPLAANSPSIGTGEWSIVSGPSTNLTQFSSTSSNTATFTPDGGVGDYVLRWTISNDPCTPSTSDVTITVKDVPALPVIAGPATVTTGNNYDYSIPTVSDATNYTWDWPATWSIVSGQGTESITVTAGTAGGDITLYVTNSCGDGPTATRAVSIGVSSDCPESTSVAPADVQTLCQDDPATQLTASVTTSGGSGTPTLLYQWYYNTSNSNIISGATLVVGATSSTYIPLTSSSELGTRYYFCVGYATDNGCGQTNATQSLASNAVEVTVITTPATPGSISGAADVSPLTSGLVYSISAVPDATSYSWAVPTGWTINSGQGTTSISVTSGSEGQNGDISVTASNTCGTSAASTLAVTVTTATLPPTITLGADPSVCQGTTTADLTYTATTESPDQYSIDYNAAAEAQGFVDVVNASLPASPITLVVPGGASGGTYSGNLSVRNSGTGLSSGSYPISVTVNTAPSTPGTIFGDASAPAETSGLMYGIASVSGATSYTWTVPGGWTITSGQGTAGIVVTSGTAGQNGNITVTATNACGTSAASVLAVTSETPLDHSLYGCNACHITHDALGGSLTNTLGNANLCMSCHVTSGAASSIPFSNADKAIPGTSGTSHAWDAQSVNSTYETVLTTDPQMVLRVDEGNITCSTCHDQHNANTNPNYTRISNAGDAMCKDCHSPRNVGRYADDNVNNKGSHPVGLAYPGSGDYAATPTGSAIVVGGNVECSSCHQTHYATTSDGYLLRQTGDDALCTSCHTLFASGGTPVGTHNGMSCYDCHQTHNTDKSNIYMIKNTITTPSSGDKPVVFTARTGTNSFADGDATYDGICEVCHTSTAHYMNDGTATDQNHSSVGGADGTTCTGCHPHNTNFSPSGGGCTDCHQTTFPGWGTTDNHATHAVRYTYSCSTCHQNYGSGGSLEGTHPSGGSANINFDPSGMATRNGNDAITPVYNGDGTCDNMYCHSDGRSAYRGQEDGYASDPYDPDTNPTGLTTWSGTTGPQTAVYATTPAWSSTGSITTCTPCHSGTGNMTDPYTITTPGLSDPLPPATGSHQRGAHTSNSQENSGNGWAAVNCFWCHNTNAGDDGSPINQGTYGTALHVDGETHFHPASYVDGGTLLDNPTGGSFSYSLQGTAAHCGDGKTCW